MSNGWFYPKKQIESQTKLIIEGVKYKNKFDFELKKNATLDSINSKLIDFSYKKDSRISELMLDSIQNRKHILMINDFQNSTVIPFYQKEIVKSKKNGILIGVLSTISIIFGSLYFSR
jgi:hypothetical protein